MASLEFRGSSFGVVVDSRVLRCWIGLVFIERKLAQAPSVIISLDTRLPALYVCSRIYASSVCSACTHEQRRPVVHRGVSFFSDVIVLLFFDAVTTVTMVGVLHTYATRPSKSLVRFLSRVGSAFSFSIFSLTAAPSRLRLSLLLSLLRKQKLASLALGHLQNRSMFRHISRFFGFWFLFEGIFINGIRLGLGLS